MRRARLVTPPVAALLLLSAIPIMQVGAGTVFWAPPAILLAALLIAWAAESAQFFSAQGFARDTGMVANAARVCCGSRAGVEATSPAASRESYRRVAIVDRICLAGDLSHCGFGASREDRPALAPHQIGTAPLAVLSKLPPGDEEGIGDLEQIQRSTS